jgi:AraC-like DNA-binding protein
LPGPGHFAPDLALFGIMLTLGHCADPQLRTSILDEVALLLGFSESSTFYRAFKRWTGQTPVEYRRKQISDPLESAS